MSKIWGIILFRSRTIHNARPISKRLITKESQNTQKRQVVQHTVSKRGWVEKAEFEESITYVRSLKWSNPYRLGKSKISYAKTFGFLWFGLTVIRPFQKTGILRDRKVKSEMAERLKADNMKSKHNSVTDQSWIFRRDLSTVTRTHDLWVVKTALSTIQV